MNATSTLQSRSHNNDLIEREFVKRILQEEADSIADAQDRVLSNTGKDDRIKLIRNSRSFVVTDFKLTHHHNMQQRFIDMKRTRFGKQKPVKVHNSIIFGHYNKIVFRLKTNLTEQLQSQIANQLNMELYG